jgi:hypothetical protein
MDRFGGNVNELALFAGAVMKTHWKSSEYAREKAKAWRLANPEKVKEHRVKNRQKNYRQEVVRKYGVDFTWFDKKFEEQNQSCAVCKKQLEWTDKQNTPHVDHCHESRKVRGILCNRCNTVLGLCFDDKELFKNLIGYLECHG